MKLRGMDYKVIDDYFPEWIVSSMSAYFETFPVTWSNSSRETYAEGGDSLVICAYSTKSGQYQKI